MLTRSWFEITLVWSVILLTLRTNSLSTTASHLTATANVELPADTETDLVFLTNVNTSCLHENDYHVVSVDFLSKKYFMHLGKPEGISPQHLHNQSELRLDCIYSGTITSPEGSNFGRVSLSSCHQDSGFEGLIFLKNQHYFIAPVQNDNDNFVEYPSRMTKRSHSYGTKKVRSIRSLKHKIGILKPKLSNIIQGLRQDLRPVSNEELRKARQQMVKDQESLQDEDEEKEDEYMSMQSEGTVSIQPSSLAASNLNEPKIFAVRNQGRPGRVNIRRIPARIIELAVFSDRDLYKVWEKKYPNNPEGRLKQYILALVNNMNMLYHQPSLSRKISFRLVHVEVQKVSPISLRESSDSGKYLDSFCQYAGKRNTQGRAWDHAMMLTGTNLKETGSDSIGVAFANTMCLREYSCSLIEFHKGFESAFTAAHELGHSLGMEHDGEAMNKKCHQSKFIMAAVAGPGQVNWSPCSSKNLENFLKSGDPRPKSKDPASIPRCLTKRGTSKMGIKYRTEFPGQKFSVEMQCRTACNQCLPHRTGKEPYNRICKMLYCKGPKGVFGVHPALEGSSCGDIGQNKRCRNGKCL